MAPSPVFQFLKTLVFDICVQGVKLHPGGNFMLSSSLDGTLKVWDIREGRLFYTVHGHEGATLGVDFSPAGDFFASCSADEQVSQERDS